MFHSVCHPTVVGRFLSRALGALIGCTACFAASTALGQATVRVEFVVEVPADTPADASVFLAGSLPQVKMWQAEGVRLEPRGAGRFGVAIDLPRGARLEYKYTRGSWESVEKSPDGTERANRTLQVTGSQTVTDAVARWASGTPAEPRQNTLTGNIRQLDDFESRILENRRPV
jgi:sirohydrochlorin ferrochelatase